MFPHSIAVSRDGRWAAVGEQDGGWLSIYDLPERKLIGRTRVGDSSVRVAFSPADAVLACAAISTSSDGGQQSRLCLRDLHDGRIITSATLNDVCQGLAYSADGETLVTSTATERGKLTLWRVRDLTPVSQSDVPQAYDTVGVHFAATHDLSDIAIAGDPTLSV